MELSRQAALLGKLKAVLSPNLLSLLVGQTEVDKCLGLVGVLGALGNGARVHDGLVRILGAHEGLLDAVIAEDIGAVDKTGHAVARRHIGGGGTNFVGQCDLVGDLGCVLAIVTLGTGVEARGGQCLIGVLAGRNGLGVADGDLAVQARDVGDGLDRADRIVASGPTPRRKRMREEEAAKFESASSGKSGRGRKGASSAAPAKGKGQDRPASADEVPPRRRRRRSSAGEESVQAAPAVDASVSAEGSAGGRRRRHRASDEVGATSRAGDARSTSAVGEAAADVAPGRSRRRKHVSSNEAAPQRSESANEAGSGGQRRKRSRKPETPSVADQLAEGNVKVQRRRPGDGGGTEAQNRSAGSSGNAEDAPKKRRRRSRRKPKQDGADGSDSAAPRTE